jgi:hypothetical protein
MLEPSGTSTLTPASPPTAKLTFQSVISVSNGRVPATQGAFDDRPPRREFVDGRDNGGPGPRPQYHAGYYAAFVLDPDGYNIEAVRHAAD